MAPPRSRPVSAIIPTPAANANEGGVAPEAGASNRRTPSAARKIETPLAVAAATKAPSGDSPTRVIGWGPVSPTGPSAPHAAPARFTSTSVAGAPASAPSGAPPSKQGAGGPPGRAASALPLVALSVEPMMLTASQPVRASAAPIAAARAQLIHTAALTGHQPTPAGRSPRRLRPGSA